MSKHLYRRVQSPLSICPRVDPETGFCSRYIFSALRNFHTDIHYGCVSMHSHQQKRSVPLLHIIASISCHSFQWSWPFWLGARYNLKVVLIYILLMPKDGEHLSISKPFKIPVENSVLNWVIFSCFLDYFISFISYIWTLTGCVFRGDISHFVAWNFVLIMFPLPYNISVLFTNYCF